MSGTSTTKTEVTETTEVVRRGFKYLYALTAKGNYARTAAELTAKGTTIQSGHDQSSWALGTWRNVDDHSTRSSRIGCCSNGFHMSDTPRQAYDYVTGNVLALVEVKGDSDHQADKSAHREMRIIAVWTAEAAQALSRADQAVSSLIDPAILTARSDAINAAYTAFDNEHESAGTDLAKAREPIAQEYRLATAGADSERSFARKVARLEYDRATSVAHANYKLAEEVAEATHTKDVAPAKLVSDQADKIASSVFSKRIDEANKVHEAAIKLAHAPAEAAQAEASTRLAEAIVAKLGKPSTVASGVSL